MTIHLLKSNILQELDETVLYLYIYELVSVWYMAPCRVVLHLQKMLIKALFEENL